MQSLLQTATNDVNRYEIVFTANCNGLTNLIFILKMFTTRVPIRKILGILQNEKLPTSENGQIKRSLVSFKPRSYLFSK